MWTAARGLVVGILFTVFFHCVPGQDLGSSNDLFVKKKPATTTAKRPWPKRKAYLPKRRYVPKSAAAAATYKNKDSNSSANGSNTKAATLPVSPGKPAAVAARSTGLMITSSPVVGEQFETLIIDGNKARSERDYPAAESVYVRAKNLKPNDWRAVYGLGNLYADQQRWDEAEISYRAAQKLDPANAVIDLALSYVLSRPMIVTNLSARYAEAEALARRAVELVPSNALAFDQLGVAMELRGNISLQTESAYRNAIRLYPTYSPAYAHLGRLFRRQGKWNESAAAFDRAINYSNDAAMLILVAEVLQSEQRYSESERLLQRAVASDPKNPTGLLLLGKALTVLGNLDEAEQILFRSLTVTQDGFVANCLLGELYLRQSKYGFAENALLRASHSVSPNERQNLSLRLETIGDGYMKAGRAEDAERVYRQAIALDAKRESLSAKLATAQRK